MTVHLLDDIAEHGDIDTVAIGFMLYYAANLVDISHERIALSMSKIVKFSGLESIIGQENQPWPALVIHQQDG